MPKVEPIAVEMTIDETTLRLRLADGRELSVPVEFFPRLAMATAAQRANWRWIGGGVGIHWPDIDEDISVPRLLGLPC